MPDELGNYVFKDMSSDTFLQTQYERLLVDYVRSRFGVVHTTFDDNYRSLLRYADLLSISDSEVYNNLAQQIVILLGKLFPNEDEVKLFKESVYQNVSNFASL